MMNQAIMQGLAGGPSGPPAQGVAPPGGPMPPGALPPELMMILMALQQGGQPLGQLGQLPMMQPPLDPTQGGGPALPPMNPLAGGLMR